MADPAAVINAVLTTLDADAALIAMVPDGAFRNVSPGGVTKAVIVSLVIHQDTYTMRERAYETFLLLVKAVERSTDPAGVNAAAARIEALLHDAVIAVTGYRKVVIRRMEHVSYAEVDEDRDEHWQHAGGRYEIWATPNPN